MRQRRAHPAWYGEDRGTELAEDRRPLTLDVACGDELALDLRTFLLGQLSLGRELPQFGLLNVVGGFGVALDGACLQPFDVTTHRPDEIVAPALRADDDPLVDQLLDPALREVQERAYSSCRNESYSHCNYAADLPPIASMPRFALM